MKKKKAKEGEKKEGDGVTDYASDDSRASGVVSVYKLSLRGPH